MYLFNNVFWKKRFRPYKKWFLMTLGLFLSAGIYGQELNVLNNQDIAKRILVAPESVFKMFREAGMAPTNHELTDIEKEKIEKAFAILPPRYQKVLKGHLHSISFMDNMPNTALTSLLESADSTKKMFNITFRAGILHETISEWATWKEYSCYDTLKTSEYKINIEAGNLDAIVYVLLHEAAHVLDAALGITPPVLDRSDLVSPTNFTEGIWYKMNVPDEKHIDSLLEKTRFRSGKIVPIAAAPDIYKALQKTPFVSLYGMASWSEDFAELATIYHLTQKMNQPFYISVKKNGLELVRFKPIKNKLVKRRLKELEFLYEV